MALSPIHSPKRLSAIAPIAAYSSASPADTEDDSDADVEADDEEDKGMGPW